MSETKNYEELYKKSEEDLRELESDYKEYKETTAMIEEELEQQITSLESKVKELEQENDDIAERTSKKEQSLKDEVKFLEGQFSKVSEELSTLKEKYSKVAKKKVELENENDRMSDQLRFKDTMVEDLNQQLESTCERLTILQMEVQDAKESSELERENFHKKLQSIQTELDLQKKKSQAKEE